MPPFDPPLTLTEVRQEFPNLTLTDVLVAGGQGAVFGGAFDGDPAVLKVFGPDAMKARVDAEIEKLSAMSSPHMVKLLHYGEKSLRDYPVPCQFCVVERVDGSDLRSQVGDFDEADTVQLIREVGYAIGTLWEERVVHRDLKPGNIIRKPDGTFVVIDLGFARHLDKSSMTQPGFVCGTLGYMAPEQYEGRRRLTLRSDFFALGIVAYEMFSGRHPFMRHQSFIGQPLYNRPPLSSDGASPGLSAVVERLLETKARSRPRSIDELHKLLP